MLRPAYLLIYWVFVHCCKPAGSVPLGSPDATAVTHPAQLQQAIRAGVKHVVVRQHLDMTSTPAFREAVSMDDGMLSLIPNAAGNHTQSIRVRRHLCPQHVSTYHHIDAACTYPC